jgi:hypothetical protein
MKVRAKKIKIMSAYKYLNSLKNDTVFIFENHAVVSLGTSGVHQLLHGKKGILQEIFSCDVAGRVHVKFEDCGCENGRHCEAWYPSFLEKGEEPNHNEGIFVSGANPAEVLKAIKREMKFARSL